MVRSSTSTPTGCSASSGNTARLSSWVSTSAMPDARSNTLALRSKGGSSSTSRTGS